MMDAAAVATIGSVVMVLVQIVKRATPDRYSACGVQICAALSIVGVLLWVVSAPVFPPARTDLFTLFAGWISVFATATGLYKSAQMATTGAERLRSRRSLREREAA
jgi:hypothetical protein